SLLGAASLLCAGELERHFAEDACDAENHVAQQGTDTACPHALFDLADLGAAALDPGHPLFSYLEPGSYVRVRSPWSFQ
ncbi:MAG: hypothetical protein RL748_4293, partial [Pseudomonadota bacterium]